SGERARLRDGGAAVGAGVSGPGAIRVVLADDHPIWRDGVAADLGEGFEVVGTAGTATEALAVIRQQRPDLVVCDLTMPDGDGLFISGKTVENHVRNILGKLQLSRRQELVRYALEHGLE